MTACRYVAATLVEHAAVNRRVVGSSPTGGAKEKKRGALRTCLSFLLLYRAIHRKKKQETVKKEREKG